VSVQGTLHRIKYSTFGAIMSSKSGETRRNCGHAAKCYAGICNARPRVHPIEPGRSTTGAMRSAAPRFPAIHRIHNMRVTSGVGHNFPFRLFPGALLAVIVGNFTLTIFFAIATQSSQPHRNLRSRANSLNRLLMQLGQAIRRSSQFLIASRLPEFQSSGISPTC
jgi:hypothetical protein